MISVMIVCEVTGIEPGSRRIVKHQRRLIHERASDRNAAPHAARKLGGIFLDRGFHFDESQGLAHALLDFLFGDVFFAQAERHIFRDGHGVEKRALLKHKSEMAAKIEQLVLP